MISKFPSHYRSSESESKSESPTDMFAAQINTIVCRTFVDLELAMKKWQKTAAELKKRRRKRVGRHRCAGHHPSGRLKLRDPQVVTPTRQLPWETMEERKIGHWRPNDQEEIRCEFTTYRHSDRPDVRKFTQNWSRWQRPWHMVSPQSDITATKTLVAMGSIGCSESQHPKTSTVLCQLDQSKDSVEWSPNEKIFEEINRIPATVAQVLDGYKVKKSGEVLTASPIGSPMGQDCESVSCKKLTKVKSNGRLKRLREVIQGKILKATRGKKKRKGKNAV